MAEVQSTPYDDNSMTRRDTADSRTRELLDVLCAQGMRDVVVSPGSRNAPLIIGLAARAATLNVHLVADERTAAFTALGIAAVSRKPVALVCTSGTALYNYAPAVAEAWEQKIPLLILTADRPEQWIGQDDSQTTRQPGALSLIVKKTFDLGTETGRGAACVSDNFPSEKEWYANRVANEAWNTAVSDLPGPVHVNIRYSEPLSNTVDANCRTPRLVTILSGKRMLTPELKKELAGRLKGKRVMAVCGYLKPDHRLTRALRQFGRLENVCVMAESLSNLHGDAEWLMVDSVLIHLSKEEIEKFKPDIILTVGGALVSRKLKEFLRRSNAEHWTLAGSDPATDCFLSLTTHIDCEPADFFAGMAALSGKETISSRDPKSSGYRALWNQKRKEAEIANQTFIARAPWSELSAFSTLLAEVPDDWNVWFSNGTAVRYAQIVGWNCGHANYCNRGVSGIEGGNGSAFGASLVYGAPTLLISGDMSFSYDTHILGLVDSNESDLRIVVVNNHGGGIFRFIPTTRRLDVREEYFCSESHLDLQGLCSAYGWNYLRANDSSSLTMALTQLKSINRTLLEIIVDPETSAGTLVDFMTPDAERKITFSGNGRTHLHASLRDAVSSQLNSEQPDVGTHVNASARRDACKCVRP